MRRATSAWITAIAIAASSSIAIGERASTTKPPAIDGLEWIHPEADPVAALAFTPAECGTPPIGVDQADAVRLGRIAFRSPVLLGGLAARVGLSCNSCHPNGHDNPAFFIAGVSDEPGTADVTGSVFSTAREDHVFNPVPIPSLVDAAQHAPFGTVLPAEDLAAFLHAAVTDEFQGIAPPPSVSAGLVAYVESLRANACPDPLTIEISFAADARELDETFEALVAALELGDARAAEFVLLSWRATLGRVYRRFPEDVEERDGLRELSVALSAQRSQITHWLGESADRSSLAAFRSEQADLLERLARRADESFYDVARLRRALRRSP